MLIGSLFCFLKVCVPPRAQMASGYKSASCFFNLPNSPEPPELEVPAAVLAEVTTMLEDRPPNTGQLHGEVPSLG
jgi:hypothetical protein